MSAKMCRVSNHERRPVVIRGLSGASIHLAALETGREIRALELEGNPMVEKLKQRNILAVEEVAPPAQPEARKTSQKSSPRKAGKKSQSVIE